MKLNRKVIRILLLASCALLAAGCSGINASHSVSPASFLLPGLMKAEPQPEDSTAPLPEVEPSIQVAVAN